MADKFKSFLGSNSLLHLLPIFEAHKIDDISILLDLTDDEILVITNGSIGDKIKLKRAIKSVKCKVDDIESTLSENETTQLPKRQKLSSVQPIVLTSSPSNLCVSQQQGPEGETIYFVNEVAGDYLVILDDQANQQLENTSSAITLTISNTPSCVSEKSSLGSSLNEPISCSGESVIPAFSEFNLKEFMKGDVIGQALLLKPRFTNCDRDRLSELIIKHLINKYGRLNNEALNILAKKIEETFTNEKSSTYFVPPFPKSRSTKNTSERSRGKLADKQRNLFFLINSINKAENSSAKKNTNTEAFIVEEREDISPEAKDSYIWLRNNSGPTSDVLHHWKNSYLVRKIISKKSHYFLKQRYSFLSLNLMFISR